MKHSPEEKMLISVVTPMYNGEKFVQSAYDCLCRQTYQNWEWVVVDDGSNDSTAKRMESLASGDQRIRFFQQKNSGSAKQPRDHAVYESRGKFILPLDVDDRLSDDYLELMMERQQQTDSDIIYPQMIFVDLDTGKTTLTLPVEGFDTEKVYAARDLVKETVPEWRIGCNGGLYRRSAWINMSYPEKTEPIWMNSDEVDERLYLINARKAAFAKARYYYQNHEASITTRISPKVFHTQKTALQLLDIMEQEFGKESEEYRRTMRRTFCDWRWKMMLFVKHHDELTDADAEIQKNLSDCFHRLDPSVLTMAERIQFLNLKSFKLIFALYCLKYKPSLLKEKIIQHRNPEGYANKYIRQREEQKVLTEIDMSYRKGVKLRKYQPYVISMFCGNAPSGGLTDRLRGAVSTYQQCLCTGRTFKLYFTHPFLLTDYLVPNAYDWTISSDEVSFSPLQSQILIASSVYDSKKERQMHKIQVQQGLEKEKKLQAHVYTNAAFCYDNAFAHSFGELFKPSARLQQHIDIIKKEIGGSYITVSARFCNCLDDFNEEVYNEPLSATERQELLNSCIAQLQAIRDEHPHDNLVICSDSTTFIEEARKHFDIYTVPGNISHIGNDSVHDYDYYEKTFLDFYTIAGACETYLLKGPHMMKSGFPYAASLVGEKELKMIQF